MRPSNPRSPLRSPTSTRWRGAMEPAAYDYSQAAPGTSRRCATTWRRGGAVGSGLASSWTSAGSTTRPRCSGRRSRCRSGSPRWPPIGLAHPDGELVTARAAAAAGIPFTLSTMSSQSLEAVADGRPRGDPLVPAVHAGRSGPHARARPARRSRRLYARSSSRSTCRVLGFRERDRRNAFELVGPHGNFLDVPGGATHGAGLHATEDGFDALDARWSVA